MTTGNAAALLIEFRQKLLQKRERRSTLLASRTRALGFLLISPAVFCSLERKETSRQLRIQKNEPRMRAATPQAARKPTTETVLGRSISKSG